MKINKIMKDYYGSVLNKHEVRTNLNEIMSKIPDKPKQNYFKNLVPSVAFDFMLISIVAVVMLNNNYAPLRDKMGQYCLASNCREKIIKYSQDFGNKVIISIKNRRSL